MLCLNGMFIQQIGHTYMVYLSTGEPVAQLFMGYDGQFSKDILALHPITKALTARWGVPNKSNRSR